MNITIPVEKLNYEVDGIRLVSPCLWFELFMEYAEGPEILDFYRKAYDILGDGLTYYDIGTGNRKRTSKRSETFVPTWCENPSTSANKQYFISLSGAEQGVTASELVVSFWPRSAAAPPRPGGAYPYSFVGCSIPLDHPLVLKGGVVEWIKSLEIVSEGLFISGSCGVAVNFPVNFPTLDLAREAKSRVASSIRRYPGLDVPGYRIGIRNGLLRIVQQPGEMSAQFSRETFLKRVNWLSFLNEQQVDLLNAQVQFESRASQLQDVTLHQLRHGLCVQAGEAPQLGDSSRGDFVPAYQSVAELLRAIRLDSVDGGPLSSALGDEGAADWLAAFDTPQ